jgi:hypothetical protein
MARPNSQTVHEVVAPFAVYRQGSPVLYPAGRQVFGDDPILREVPDAFVDVTDRINQPAPIDMHPARMPSGVTNEQATMARDVRNGPRNKGGATVPHVLPPEHEDSAASTFAPFQPAAGVQADDAVEKGQSPKGALKASEAQEKYAGKVLDTSPGHTGEALATAVVATDTDKSGGDPLKSKSGEAPVKDDVPESKTTAPKPSAKS